MFVHDKNQTSNLRLSCLFLIMLLLMVLPAGAEQKQKTFFGLYTGWSFALGEQFIDESPGGHTFNHYKPNLVLGGYVQHNFVDWFGLQLNVNYQNCSNHWFFVYFDRYDSGTTSLACLSFNLNGLVTLSRSAMTQVYLLGGIGMFTGPFDYKTTFVQFSGGIGGKFRVKPGSQTFVNLAAIFHHFLYKYGGGSNADYLRLQAGIEIPLRLKEKAEGES